MEAADYVRRVPEPGDRRKVLVEPIGRPAGLNEAMAPARQRIKGDFRRVLARAARRPVRLLHQGRAGVPAGRRPAAGVSVSVQRHLAVRPTSAPPCRRPSPASRSQETRRGGHSRLSLTHSGRALHLGSFPVGLRLPRTFFLPARTAPIRVLGPPPRSVSTGLDGRPLEAPSGSPARLQGADLSSFGDPFAGT
ncbi:hypothetical protein [Actinomadura sp. NBRC 104425]|uniref:hypothetical protein n=1 Tax=Actinomadura sp. NBRC 104425 TaxID=3032204 RepID=UPI00255534CE|nr:hypothetical protein [Actinomadura sp. NBRC 104425]